MNTPPKSKRFSVDMLTTDWDGLMGGGYSGSIKDPAIAAFIGQLTCRFVHLEGLMAYPLAQLSGSDPTSAGYMLSAIKSPRGRLDLMLTLLEKAPANYRRGREWDEMLSEFWRINKRRNAYIHGQWWTKDDDGTTWLNEENDLGFSFAKARQVKAAELEKLLVDIGRLTMTIIKIAMLSEQQKRSLTQPPETNL